MLYLLLQDIQKIIPVSYIEEKNSSIIVHYFLDNTPNENQLEQINDLIEQWPINKAKLEKIQVLDNLWKNKIKAGWQTPDGYYLGLEISDITLLNGAFTLAKEAHSIGITDPINIVDLNGQSHSLNLQDLTILMLQYGQARANLSNSYATIKQSINSSNTIEELENININI